MSFDVKWRPEALKDLRKLPHGIAQRIVAKVSIAREFPHHFFERLADDPGYKLRVGDYRIIADIISEDKTIVVRIIGHRKNIYDRI